jgi:hypothetical protein
MSFLCRASEEILVLNNEDLVNLGYSRGPPVPHTCKGISERLIDIKLSCEFAANDPESSVLMLAVLTWNHGDTKLCGQCSFCNILNEGMQRSVESDLWNLNRFGPIQSSRILGLQSVRFGRLEYHTDPMPRTVRKTGTVVADDVYLLRLSGHLLLKPDYEAEVELFDVFLHFELFGESWDPVVELLKLHRRPLQGVFLSPFNISKVRDWIQDCDDNHESCWSAMKHLNYRTPIFLPTRLINVGDEAQNMHPRLVITSKVGAASLPNAAKYIALSYCWGTVEQAAKLPKTTHDTILSRIEKIEFKTMPQTFQDAITVARTLGIKHLWIDSLCIIQDDPRDWEIESSKMAAIFSNAYLTLVAASGSSCNDSFLRREISGLTCTIPMSSKQGQKPIEGQYSLRFRRQWGKSDKMADISGSRWLTRGWTFQEERLARRVLMFGKTKFFFDCKTVERVEDSDACALRPGWVKSVSEVLLESHQPNRGEVAERSDKTQHWENWQTLCTHYSYRELTFPSDKLPAISGIASNFAAKSHSKYLAGLWQDNLVHDLFWQSSNAATRPPEYRAPSWSWASLDGRILWPSWRVCLTCIGCKMYCTVLDVHILQAGMNPYGAVKDGFLKVHGRLEVMDVEMVDENSCPRRWRLVYNGKGIGSAKLDRILQHSTNRYQALTVATCQELGGNRTLTRGLLLQKNGRERGGHVEFERVGTFTLSSSFVPARYEGLSIGEINPDQVIMIV